jgi:mycothiol synthase
MTYRIEEWDPRTASDEVNRALYDVGLERHEEEESEDPVEPYELWLQRRTDLPSWSRPKRWAAWHEATNDAVGYGYLGLEYTDDNRHLAWFDAYVRPAHRRQGIATRVVERIVDAARADDRTLLGGGGIDGGPGEQFLTALGLTKKMTERKSRLTIANVDRGMLEDWVARAEERAADYELISFDDRCPEDLLEPFVDLVMVMNTAPRDDIDMEDWIETPERYREREEKSLAKGMRNWRLIARHVPSGELAGFTEFFFPPHTEELVIQEATGVRPTHRDKGLGRWLKAANLLRLLDERPQAKYVDTWNAFSNGPMLGINIAMGFEIVRGYAAFQATTDDLAAAVKERLGG